jgi:hypothetical protein
VPPEHDNHFWRLVAPEIRDLRRALQEGFGDALEELVRRGQFQSGRTMVVLTDLARANLRQRVEKAWEVLQRVLSDVGVTPDSATSDSLTIVVGRFITQQLEEVEADLKKATPPNLLRTNGPELEQEAIAQRERIEAELALLMEKLRRQRAPQMGQPVFNFHAPVGAVQTGPGAVANVNQALAGPGLNKLTAALEQLTTALAAAADVDPDTRSDITAVVTDVRAEIQKPRPNVAKITGLAYGLATTIQTIASLAPAYHVVKAAFSSVGIVLP